MTASPRWPLRILSALLVVSGLLAAAPPARAQGESVIDKLLDMTRDKKKIEPKDGDDEIRKLSIKRYNVALDELTVRCEEFRKNIVILDKVFQAARDLLDAEMSLQEKPEGRVAVLEKTIEVLKWYEAKQERGLQDGVGLKADLLRTQYVRLSLEIDLVKARREVAGDKPK
jgi:hypothetical protein